MNHTVSTVLNPSHNGMCRGGVGEHKAPHTNMFTEEAEVGEGTCSQLPEVLNATTNALLNRLPLILPTPRFSE